MHIHVVGVEFDFISLLVIWYHELETYFSKEAMSHWHCIVKVDLRAVYYKLTNECVMAFSLLRTIKCLVLTQRKDDLLNHHVIQVLFTQCIIVFDLCS